jgi:hypothetical protein
VFRADEKVAQRSTVGTDTIALHEIAYSSEGVFTICWLSNQRHITLSPFICNVLEKIRRNDSPLISKSTTMHLDFWVHGLGPFWMASVVWKQGFPHLAIERCLADFFMSNRPSFVRPGFSFCFFSSLLKGSMSPLINSVGVAHSSDKNELLQDKFKFLVDQRFPSPLLDWKHVCAYNVCPLSVFVVLFLFVVCAVCCECFVCLCVCVCVVYVACCVLHVVSRVCFACLCACRVWCVLVCVSCVVGVLCECFVCVYVCVCVCVCVVYVACCVLHVVSVLWVSRVSVSCVLRVGVYRVLWVCRLCLCVSRVLRVCVRVACWCECACCDCVCVLCVLRVVCLLCVCVCVCCECLCFVYVSSVCAMCV